MATASGDVTGTTAVTHSWRPVARPMRADARRNRDAVLIAAAAAFAIEGVDTSLEDIARTAGVGIGTLYRHFPTREALVLGVYRREVEHLADSARELAAEMLPAEALREWMRRFVQYAATKRGMIGMLHAMVRDESEAFNQAKEQIRQAAATLLDAAASSGAIRGDVSAEDLTRSIGGICMASDPAAGSACPERLVDLVFDGLRFGASTAR
ncbi:MAG: TetR/AcrR family transcriptional regulator [Nakamurella sp.]